MIGENIQKLSVKKGISVPFLADNLGMSVQNVYRLFKKQSIESKHLVRLSEILDVPVGLFFSDVMDKTFPGKSKIELEKELDQLSSEYARSDKARYEQIQYLKEQVNFYREQAESLKTINEQLRKIINESNK